MNAGTRAIEWLFAEQLKVDRHWAVRTPEGFRWWADKQEQRIEIVGEMEGGPDGAVGYLVRVQTDVLREVELDADNLSAINGAVMSFASMSGLVHDEEARTLSLSSLARVWDQNEAWLNPFISMAAVLQIGEARMLAPQLATQLGAEVAISGHPDHGLRARPDEMAGRHRVAHHPHRQGTRGLGGRGVRERRQGVRVRAGHDLGDARRRRVHRRGRRSATCPRAARSSRAHATPSTAPACSSCSSCRCPRRPSRKAPGSRSPSTSIELAREPLGYGFGSYAWRDRWMYFVSFFPNALVPARDAPQPRRLLRPARAQSPGGRCASGVGKAFRQVGRWGALQRDDTVSTRSEQCPCRSTKYTSVTVLPSPRSASTTRSVPASESLLDTVAARTS